MKIASIIDWRPAHERPASGGLITAVFAERDGLGGVHLLEDIYVWRGGQWLSEITGQPLPAGGERWRVAEADLVAPLAMLPEAA